jgi:hypothetical protein
VETTNRESGIMKKLNPTIPTKGQINEHRYTCTEQPECELSLKHVVFNPYFGT